MSEVKEKTEETEKTEEETRLKVHSSGLQYYEIRLESPETGEKMFIRLFESFSPARLKWDDDEETHDEYKIRRNYIQRGEKEQKKGNLVWNAAWGTFNQTNALRVQAAINEGRDLNTIGKLINVKPK